ncbi:proline-rich protein 36-like [Sarcophilus harrisii]|uniref:proline-rich protein 36-like n=1 Tax=Sarcophilus harrisii TaxID=9305 RepID=UPI001301B1F7|nr:proline-rich protein 36-like [Sarcophilus harrisii]
MGWDGQPRPGAARFRGPGAPADPLGAGRLRPLTDHVPGAEGAARGHRCRGGGLPGAPLGSSGGSPASGPGGGGAERGPSLAAAAGGTAGQLPAASAPPSSQRPGPGDGAGTRPPGPALPATWRQVGRGWALRCTPLGAAHGHPLPSRLPARPLGRRRRCRSKVARREAGPPRVDATSPPRPRARLQRRGSSPPIAVPSRGLARRAKLRPRRVLPLRHAPTARPLLRPRSAPAAAPFGGPSFTMTRPARRPASARLHLGPALTLTIVPAQDTPLDSSPSHGLRSSLVPDLLRSSRPQRAPPRPHDLPHHEATPTPSSFIRPEVPPPEYRLWPHDLCGSAPAIWRKGPPEFRSRAYPVQRPHPGHAP